MKEKISQPDLPGAEIELTEDEKSERMIKGFMEIIESRPYADRNKIDLKDQSMDHQLIIDSMRSELSKKGVGFHHQYDVFSMVSLYNQAMDRLIEKTRRAVKAKRKNIEKKKKREQSQGDLFEE